MTTKHGYISLSSRTMDPCDLTRECYAQARATWLCTGCCTPKPDSGTIDVHLEYAPKDKPLNFINGCGLGVVYRPFFDELPHDLIRKYLMIGRVFWPDGRIMPDWATFRSVHRVIIRGVEHAAYRTCDKCGRTVYFAMGKRYLSPEPPKDIPLFTSNRFGFVLTSDLYNSLSSKKWRKLNVGTLPVYDEPLDGLGVLPNP